MIIIENMEMPKCCGECYLCDFSECGIFCPLLSVEKSDVEHYIYDENGRHPSCPLKEVK